MSLRQKLIDSGQIRPAKPAATPAVNNQPRIIPAKPNPKKEKAYRNWTAEEKIAARAKANPPAQPLRCILCGAIVSKGKMLKHKAAAHGEQDVTASPPHPLITPRATFVRGGSPGLKKK